MNIEDFDGLPYMLAGSMIETDAPVADGSKVYGSSDTFIVGTDPEGHDFHWVLTGGAWENLTVDKPVADWTNDDWSSWETDHPTSDDGAWTTTPDPNDPDLNISLMSLGSFDHLVTA